MNSYIDVERANKRIAIMITHYDLEDSIYSSQRCLLPADIALKAAWKIIETAGKILGKEEDVAPDTGQPR